MGEICRLCCSTKFVNNNIFDEESALYVKMSLYLPIKVFSDDKLPQKICDKCSCKVNDFYQFCSEAIEVESRLRSLLLMKNDLANESVDLTVVKGSSSPPPPNLKLSLHKSTQTESNFDFTYSVQVKEEPKPAPMLPIKEENTFSDHMDAAEAPSSDSEDVSLITLKKKKPKKLSVNGEEKKARKKKGNIENWEMLMSALPAGTELTVVDNKAVALDAVKVEVDEDSQKHVDVYQCCICFAKCYKRTEMLQHYRKHANESAAGEPPAAPPPPDQDPLRCTRCRKVLSRADWPAHWARHWARDRRPYRCGLCEKAYRDPHQILKHGLTHNFEEGVQTESADKRFLCDLCPEAFVYMRSLLAHRTRAHPEAAGRALALRCGACARHFAHINSLHRHLRAHSGERNFLCNICGKALSSREHLKFHIRIHTGYKPNVCKTCGKGFVKKCNLTLHERVHSGEKPHVCSHCGKAFSQRSTLVIHERYHSGARPYVCGLCGRGFVAKGLLSMHLKTTCI